MSSLRGQVSQFDFDLETFAKYLNLDSITQARGVTDETVTLIPELDSQAQELWKDYHPESDEVFWELYNELLAKVKESSVW